METSSSDRAAAGLIAGSAVLSLAALAFDQGPSSADFREVLGQLAALSFRRGAVHAVEIACVTGLAAGYSAFAARLDLRRPAVQAGLIAFLAGCLLMIVTACFDGFITQAVAARYAEASAEQLDVARGLLRLCGMVVTYLGDASFGLMMGGTSIWAVLLCRDSGFLSRLAGLIGLAGGAITFAAIFLSPNLGLPLLMGIVFAQMLWYFASAAVLARG